MTLHCHPCTRTAVHILALGYAQQSLVQWCTHPCCSSSRKNMAGTGMMCIGLVLGCETKPWVVAALFFTAMKRGCGHPWYMAVKRRCGTAIFLTMLYQRIFSHSWYSLCSSSRLVQLLDTLTALRRPRSWVILWLNMSPQHFSRAKLGLDPLRTLHWAVSF